VVVGSPAAKAGLRAGDVIVAVEGKGVATVAELRQALEIKPGEEKRKLNLTVVRDHQELTVPVELEKPGLGERERVATVFGIDAGEWQRAAAEVRAQLAAAQLALQQAQKQLRDEQLLMSEKMRHATEEYRRAIQEQLQLQLQKQLNPLAGQNRAI
jgi:type IV secretory pathway VirB9-like protein